MAAAAAAAAASNGISGWAEAEQEPERAARLGLPRRAGGGRPAGVDTVLPASRHRVGLEQHEVVEGVVSGIRGVEKVLKRAPVADNVDGAGVGGVEDTPDGGEEGLEAPEVACRGVVELREQREALADEAGEHGRDERRRRPSERRWHRRRRELIRRHLQ
ncbi:Os03g0573600 [Oryza sativa Japonica Group]|uniref:Os03g0573600 protein n=2 Tax=Oryza sativa subsp. japonica TaxID=39947 RepID=Q0DQP8_ORYSJ|nr:hypothetical protein EE612_018552 [Oryza sativa]BAF12440.1 Os03g0573600 [Oryza sativa Japonica Group]BAS85008.1 Os03g0573600 [Oryza sativa Japonica Group]|eukprot:NP_001050526.1 Os03g0573600 [Oryza sativa Japonica Group]